MRVLISDPDQKWVNQVEDKLKERLIEAETCHTGKDAQLKLYRSVFDILLLDLDTRDHSGLEVLKYVKTKFPKVRIILTVSSEKKFEELGLDTNSLKKLGANEVIVKPCQLIDMIEQINPTSELAQWKNVASSETILAEEDCTAADEEFTRIRIDDLFMGNHSIFDHYLKLVPGKYVKVFHQGQKFDEERLAHFRDEKKVEYLYFKTKDRGTYVNYINDVLDKTVKSKTMTAEEKVRLTKSVAEKYIDEIYTIGLKSQLVEEGFKVCQNMHELIQRDQGLAELLPSAEEYESPAQAHLFLTTFMSVLICKNLDWMTNRTVEITAMGAFLHDIGRIKLPPELKEMPVEQMTTEQKAIYQTHPLLGVQILENYSNVTDPVKQIIYQHHETMDGEGFPNRLSGLKIYPMAKIVALADEFSHHLMSQKLTPLVGLRSFAQNPHNIKKYDTIAIRSLIMGFMKDK